MVKILVDLRALAPHGTTLPTSSASAPTTTAFAPTTLIAAPRRSAGVAGTLSAGMITPAAFSALSARFAAGWFRRLDGGRGGAAGLGRRRATRGRDLFAQLRDDSLKHVD